MAFLYAAFFSHKSHTDNATFTQALMEKMTTMLPLTNGKINVLEIPILENVSFEEKELKDMDLPRDVIVGCIVRGDRSIIPSGNTKLLTGDIVILIVNGAVKEEVVKIFTGQGVHAK